MKDLILNIVSYLKYLNKTCNLSVSFHLKSEFTDCIPQDIFALISPFNCHTNPYCMMSKRLDYSKCIENQISIFKNIQDNKPFLNCCHAGVYEYIFPFLKENTVAGYVTVSGYKPKGANKYIILNNNLWNNSLKDNIPFDLCNSIIPPLCIMLEKMLCIYSVKCDNEFNMLVNFLNEYHLDISLSDLANHFKRSKSHISHLFKKESGMTIRAYCNDLKLEDSKNLLLNTDLSITEIAYDTGFNDTSYFINLFKSKFGITPLQFRQKKYTS